VRTKPNLSRFFRKRPWFQEQVNARVRYVLSQTKDVRLVKDGSVLVVDDTLCEHVGSLFDYIDRHYNHGDNTLPVGPQPSDQPLREWASAVSGRSAMSTL